MSCAEVAVSGICPATKSRLSPVWIGERHIASTVRAFYKPHKHIWSSSLIWSFLYTDEFLYQFKGFFINDSFMGVFYNNPIFLRNRYQFSVLEWFCLCLVRYHMTEIHLIFQNHLNIFSNPVGRESEPCACFQRAILHCSVGSRNQNLFFTQCSCYLMNTVSLFRHFKNTLDDRRCFRVYQ